MTDDRTAPPPPDDAALERLSALIDGELPEQEHVAVLAALARDGEAAARVTDYQRQAVALKALFPLQHDVRYLIVPVRASRVRRAATALTWAALGVVLGTGVAWLPEVFADPAAFAHRADVAYAVYAPERRHPVEVDASDQAHLSAWLSNRLARSVTIPVLDEYGYALVGGRLLPGATSPAALLMYQNTAGKRLTLYTGAAGARQSTFRTFGQDDRRTFYWAIDGAGYAISGQRAEPRLREIAADVCSGLGGHPDHWK